jgi:hypothetical protein
LRSSRLHASSATRGCPTQRHLTSRVTCPVNIVQQKGVVFYCQAAVGARNFRVVVTEVDSDGHVTFVVT